MANQTVGINVGVTTPYAYTVTASGTLIGSDMELVIDLTKFTSKEQVLLGLDTLKQIFVQSDAANALLPAS